MRNLAMTTSGSSPPGWPLPGNAPMPRLRAAGPSFTRSSTSFSSRTRGAPRSPDTPAWRLISDGRGAGALGGSGVAGLAEGCLLLLCSSLSMALTRSGPSFVLNLNRPSISSLGCTFMSALKRSRFIFGFSAEAAFAVGCLGAGAALGAAAAGATGAGPAGPFAVTGCHRKFSLTLPGADPA